MVTYNSRLARREARLSRRQTYLFLAGSAILIVALILFGLPLLFRLTGAISGINEKTANQGASQGLAPTIPELSQDLSATNTAQITISGFADAKTTIQLFHNNIPDQTVVSGDDGKFEFPVTLDKGTNSFAAQAIADAGQKSAQSQTYSVSYLTGNPKLDISTPNDNDAAISGQTDPGDSVSINDHLVIVDSLGKFSSPTNLKSGDNNFKIVATDQAGNTTVKQVTIKSTTTP